MITRTPSAGSSGVLAAADTRSDQCTCVAPAAIPAAPTTPQKVRKRRRVTGLTVVLSCSDFVIAGDLAGSCPSTGSGPVPGDGPGGGWCHGMGGPGGPGIGL